MTDLNFYDIIDGEIDKLVKKNENDSFLKKQSTDGKKSYGFLLWFLQRYIPNQKLTDLKPSIVEGNDDSSCDLIFENKDNEDNDIFYVVQAKWFSRSNVKKTNKMSKELKSCITDFNLILKGKKSASKVNEAFNEKYEELLEHKKNNGRIKFIFIHLCQPIGGIEEYVNDFSTKLVQISLLSIQDVKEQYIEIEYKGIKTHNPLELPYTPKNSIDISVEPNHVIEIPRPLPYQAYIFLVRPKQITELFDQFGLGLFYKNIRNPLSKSFYNNKIVETLENNPLNFWYFNNGITAITDSVEDFYPDNGKITISGIQVINGAQTVFSIHKAYTKASDAQRKIMDRSSLITLRLLHTGGKDFDLYVTKYTNSQNPISERDFHSNDDVQKRLQKEFLINSNVWYETRRGEFTSSPHHVKQVSNISFAQTYLAFEKQQPASSKSKKAFIFISRSENSEGLYETIFNDDTDYLTMLVSYYAYLYVDSLRRKMNSKIKKVRPNRQGIYSEKQQEVLQYEFLQYASYPIVALMKLYFDKKVGYKNKKSYLNQIVNSYSKGNDKVFESAYEFIVENMRRIVNEHKENDPRFTSIKYFKSFATYPIYSSKIMNKFEK